MLTIFTLYDINQKTYFKVASNWLGCRTLEFLPPKYKGRNVSRVKWLFVRSKGCPSCCQFKCAGIIPHVSPGSVCDGTCGLTPGAYALLSFLTDLIVSKSQLFSWSDMIIRKQNSGGEKDTDFYVCMCTKGWNWSLPKLLPDTSPHLPQIPLHSEWTLPFNFLSYLALRLHIDPLHVSRDASRRWHVLSFLPAHSGSPQPPFTRSGTFKLGYSFAALWAQIPPHEKLSALGLKANCWDTGNKDKEQICGKASRLQKSDSSKHTV